MFELEAVFARMRQDVAAAKVDRAASERQIAGLREGMFASQIGVLDDTARRQVLLCAGRAGKTTVTGRDLAITARTKRRGNILYLTLDKKVARRYLWGELQQLDHDHKLGFEFKSGDDLVIDPVTGSIIYFGGAETVDACEKYRGTPWDLVVIDEAKSIPLQNLHALLNDILPPRMRDRRGRLRVQGTPGEALTGDFWRISDKPALMIRDDGKRRVATSRPYKERTDPRWKGVDWEWSHHHWPLSENNKLHYDDCVPGCDLPHLWLEALEEMRQKGRSPDHPSHRRENLGEWAADLTGKCYFYDPKLNLWTPDWKAASIFDRLPAGHDWYFAIGVDFGTTDKFAVITWAFAEDYRDLLQVDAFRARGMSIRQQAKILRTKYDACAGRCVAMKGDPARKAIMLELQQEYEIPIEPADKADKLGAMEMMKGDQMEGRVKAFTDEQGEPDEITLEWATLILDPEKGREVEGMPADNADAGLYGYRPAQHRMATDPAPKPPARGTPEHDRLLEDLEEQRACEREKALDDPEAYDATIESVTDWNPVEDW